MAGKERAEVEKLLEGGEKEVVVVVDEEAKEDEGEEKEEQEAGQVEARRRGLPASRCLLMGAMGRQAILL